MKSSRKKLIGLAILLLFLVPLGISVKEVYREVRQPELNAALIAAVRKNDTVKVVSLLSQGADANARDLPPDTRSMLLRLWDRIDRNPLPEAEGRTALLVTLEEDNDMEFLSENVPLVKALLDAGAAVNAPDEIGRTPLMLAAEAAKRETVRLLLDKGALANARGFEGNTALHLAAEQDDLALTKLLLAKGAQVNSRTEYGTTPMHNAAAYGQIECVRLLIESGGDIDAHDHFGSTPLSEAAQSTFRAVVQLLISRGAKVNIRNGDGDTPLKFARRNHDPEMVKVLVKAGEKE